jgi:hypothetical protein
VDSTLAFSVFAIGAAVVAFWTVACYPTLGPQTFLSALLLTAAVFVLQLPLPTAVASVSASRGAGAALLLVVLPALALLFWAAGCLVRSLVTLLAPHRR